MKIAPTRYAPAFATVFASVILAACATGVTVTRENISHSYLPEELYVVATGENELRTTILGNPFSVPTNALETAVLRSIEGQNFGPNLNLATTPKREDTRKRNVVLAFNLTSPSQAKNLCSGTGETVKAADTRGDLTVTGVYCAGGRPLTQATARSANVTGPDTEQFRQLMTQLAIAIFPGENPHRQLDGPGCLNC